MRRLRSYIEPAKKILSSAPETEICVECMAEDEDLIVTLTRANFEHLCRNDFEKTIPCIESALKDAKLKVQDIDEVLLVGGSTRIPKIKQIISEFMNGKKLNFTIDADEAVAQGAAIQAAMI